MSKKQNTAINLGATYETRVSMWTFVSGYTRELNGFKLESEVEGTEKFDDVVFDDGSGLSQMIQLKHKKNDEIVLKESKDEKSKTIQNEQEEKLVKQVIKVTDLFNEKYNTNYNLIKYVKDYNFANSTDRFKDKIKAAVVFTNIGFDLKNYELNLKGSPSKAAKVWFAGINSIKLTPIQPEPAAIFNMSSVAPDAKYFKFTDDPNIVKILQRQSVTLANNVGAITEDEIRAALEKVIYAVEQPNVQKLPDIIKDEIKDHFKINDVDSIYEKLETYFRSWCESKNPFGQLSTGTETNISKQYVLAYGDADHFFQNHVKKISFGVTAPTDAFTGRIQELEEIRRQLNKKSSIIVSSTLTISGLGGIGKTQLVKQFIQKFGQEFYDRVMWIEAESEDTVKNSFERLAQLLNIYDVYHKNIKVLIDEVFEYFAGLKVLFVFDNFDKSSDYEGNLVNYCWETVSDPTKRGRPYFLVTSRNRNCLPGVPLLDLNVLSAEEAIQLIRKELTELNLTDADAEKLVNILQYFPLALRQAIAFIKQQHIRKQLFHKRYEIQDYFSKFGEETEKLLDFKFPGDFGKNEKTTFITWNVTLDAIRAEKVDGKNAIQVLKIFAYLYPDKIDPKMFLTLFDNADDKTADALLLLEKYSMITKVTQDKSTFYQIHRLVQAVVQLKFQDESGAIMEQAFKLINPADRIKLTECSVHQLLHYNYLSVYMMKHDELKTNKEFFNSLNSEVLERAAVYDDDVEKIKALKIPSDDLKMFFKNNIHRLIYNECNKVIKYLIESGQLKVNDQIGGNSLIKWSVDNTNFVIFKYLIEQGADFSEVLVFGSLEFICEVKTGKSDLLQNFINSKSAINQDILNECLFFATIFNQESIVRILLKNIVEPNLKYKNWSLINVAARFGYKTILNILLIRYRTVYDSRRNLKACLKNLLKLSSYSDKEAFEMIYKEFFRDIDDNYELWDILCYNFNICKLDLAYVLLHEGADDAFSGDYGSEALINLLERHENNKWSVEDKRRFDELLNRIILHNLTPKKFIHVSVDCIFRVDNYLTNEFYRNLFEKMVKQIGDINIRNTKGGTLLIKYLQDRYWYSWPFIEIVKYLVEHGVDIEIQDNEGKPALYYAVKKFDVFEYLLAKSKSIDENVLENAIKEDALKIIQKLLEKHVSSNFCFKNGKTLIEVAIENVSLVVLLCKDNFKKYLEQGGDVNKRDENGQTLLSKLFYKLKLRYLVIDSIYSWYRKRYDALFDDVKFLVENGVDVDIRDNNGHSALYYAATEKTKDIFSYLLEHSKSVDENTSYEAINHDVLLDEWRGHNRLMKRILNRE